MDLLQLRTLLTVARHGSFAAAARVLDQDPSAVSRTVAAAEAHLGVRLFQRSTRRLAVTGVGQAYLDRIAPLLEELEIAAEEARSARRAPSGTLRLTASVAWGQECLVPLLPEFRSLYPEITLDLRFADANLDLLAEGIDLAIRVGNLTDSALIARRLASIDLGIYASPGYLKQAGVPDTPDDLRQHNCLGMRKTDNSWAFRNWQDGEAVSFSGRLRANSLTFLREMILQDIGVARMPTSFVEDQVARGELVTLLPEYDIPPIDIHAVYPSRRHLNPKVRLFIDHMQDQLREHSWVRTH